MNGKGEDTIEERLQRAEFYLAPVNSLCIGLSLLVFSIPCKTNTLYVLRSSNCKFLNSKLFLRQLSN